MSKKYLISFNHKSDKISEYNLVKHFNSISRTLFDEDPIDLYNSYPYEFVNGFWSGYYEPESEHNEGPPFAEKIQTMYPEWLVLPFMLFDSFVFLVHSQFGLTQAD